MNRECARHPALSSHTPYGYHTARTEVLPPVLYTLRYLETRCICTPKEEEKKMAERECILLIMHGSPNLSYSLQMYIFNTDKCIESVFTALHQGCYISREWVLYLVDTNVTCPPLYCGDIHIVTTPPRSESNRRSTY